MNSPRKWTFARIDVVGAAVALAATTLFYWLAVSPILASQECCKAQRTQLEAQNRDIARLAAQTRGLRRSLDSTDKAFDTIGVRLEPAETVNARISLLTSLAGRNNLKVDEVRPAEPSFGKEYGAVPIVLNGQGGFRDWSAFLHDLCESVPDTSVDSFVLSGRSGASSDQIAFRVALLWYVLPAK